MSPRHGLMDPREEFLQVKNDPENLTRFCSMNSLPGIGTGSSVTPADLSEDSRLRGHLLQEITRVAESFEPHNGALLTSSTSCRGYNFGPEVIPASEADCSSRGKLLL